MPFNNEKNCAFQREVRDWITANRAEVAEEDRPSSRTVMSPRSGCCSGERSSAARLGFAPNWPKEYGGAGWNSTQKFIFEMEMARTNSTYLSSFSIKMVAPVLMKSAGSGAEADTFAPEDPPPPRSCGARAIPSQGSGCDPIPKTKASTREKAGRESHNWSTGRRSGPPMPSTPTGSLPGAHLSEGKRQEGNSFLLMRHEVAGHQGASGSTWSTAPNAGRTR